MTDTAEQRRDLASALVAGATVRSPWLRRAFDDTPREMFVPRFYRAEAGREVLVDGTDPQQQEQWLRGVYTDEVLTVQLTPAPDLAPGASAPTSSSSMPTVMAGMLEALDLRPDHRVLEVGTGTGYHTALLCHRVGADNVVSVELDPAMADAARRTLTEGGLFPAVHAGDETTGLASAAPFDRIIATAATDHMTAIDREVVEGSFLNLPGAFMPMRTGQAARTATARAGIWCSISATRSGERARSIQDWWQTTPRCDS